MKIIIALISASMLFATNAWAGKADLDLLGALSGYAQGEFKNMSRQLGLAIAYKAAAPAEPLGVTGFDAGVEISTAEIDESKSFWKEVAPDMPGAIVVPKIRIQKGLPFGIDIGGSYASIPESDITLTGLELKYAILEGGVASPAVAIRGSYSRLDGIDDLAISTTGADLSISKGLAMLTPYAGVGQVWITSDPSSKLSPLKSESLSETKYFVGARLSLGLLMINLEYEQAEIPSYTARLSVGF